jgi:hypothetical protein
MVVAAVGCTLGMVPHMLPAITGLVALLHTDHGLDPARLRGGVRGLGARWALTDR